jgi:hypothetical protein
MNSRNDIQDGVTRMVRVLLALNGRLQKDLAEPLGVNVTGVSARMNKGIWTIEDLHAMAAFFDVPIATFFDDPRARFDQQKLTSGWNDASAEYAEVTGG